jgi:hypothetical protein
MQMKLGAGRLSDEALLFANLEGEPLQPSNLAAGLGSDSERFGMPEVTFAGCATPTPAS